MKVQLSSAFLGTLPFEIHSVVTDWRMQHRKKFISVNRATKFYVEEDAKFTAFGPDLRSMTVRAGGEWAGVTALMPGSDCPLPPGCTVIATGYFQGLPWLTIYHNPEGAPEKLARLAAFVSAPAALPA